MRKIIFLFLLGSFLFNDIKAQNIPVINKDMFFRPKNDTIVNSNDTLYKNSDYKYFTLELDTAIVDTSLTIKKHRKLNFFRKDIFGVQSFSNIGSRYNVMKFIANPNIVPVLGASTKQFKYQNIDDAIYYDVKTPFSEIYYLEGLEEGQITSALITLNILKQWNLAINYKGVRTLGDYEYDLADATFFSGTTNVNFKKFKLKSHFTYQNLNNRENGGLAAAKKEFDSGEEKFIKSRTSLKINLNPKSEVNTFLKGKQFYLSGEYELIEKLHFGYNFRYETQFYKYTDKNNLETSESDLYNKSGIRNKTATIDSLDFKQIQNDIFIKFNTKKYQIQTGLSYQQLAYNNDTLQVNATTTEFITAKIRHSFQFKKLKFKTHLNYNINGLYKDNFHLSSALSYTLKYIGNMSVTANIYRNTPAFNTQFYNSNYEDFNWKNNFENELTQQYTIQLKIPYKTQLEAGFINIDNFVYWNATKKPQQYKNIIEIFQTKITNQIDFWKFSLSNTLQYQKVLNDSDVYRIPKILVRTELFYSDIFWEKRSMFAQIGVAFSYFSSYKSNAFSPLLNEYHLQNDLKIGGYPMFEFFINAKVRTMRLFLKVENLSSLIDYTMRNIFDTYNSVKFNYYSAPYYPFRDWMIRMGIVWNFFS